MNGTLGEGGGGGGEGVRGEEGEGGWGWGGKRTNENAPAPRNITFFMGRLLHKLDAESNIRGLYYKNAKRKRKEL
jgi:hypothetical protein